MQAELEEMVMEMLPFSKLNECADEIETETGSALLGSSGGSWISDGTSVGLVDNLEDASETMLEEAEVDSVCAKETEEISAEELCPMLGPTVGRPAGCPVDPCRIVMSIASRKIRTPRCPTLPAIPEEQPAFAPTSRTPFWKKFFCCFGSAEDPSATVEAAPRMRRTKSSSLDLAALGA